MYVLWIWAGVYLFGLGCIIVGPVYDCPSKLLSGLEEKI